MANLRSGLVRNLHTWKADGTFLAWQMDMHCDDYLQPGRKLKYCPVGTKEEDIDKCWWERIQSLCPC